MGVLREIFSVPVYSATGARVGDSPLEQTPVEPSAGVPVTRWTQPPGGMHRTARTPRSGAYAGFPPDPRVGALGRTPRTPASPGMSQNARYDDTDPEIAHWEARLRQLHAERADELQRAHDDTKTALDRELAAGMPESHPLVAGTRVQLAEMARHVNDRRLLAAGKQPLQKYERPRFGRYAVGDEFFLPAVPDATADVEPPRPTIVRPAERHPGAPKPPPHARPHPFPPRPPAPAPPFRTPAAAAPPEPSAPRAAPAPGPDRRSGGGTHHAPAGGATVAGKKFAGGQFIPNEVMASASPAERAHVEGRPAPPASRPVAGPPDDPFEVSRHLTPDEQHLERESQTYVRKHYPVVRSKYLAKNATFDSTGTPVSVTLNTDEWREHVPGYVGTNAGAVHEAASWANKQLYKESLKVMRGKGNGKLMVLAGGGGSGKGTATGDFFVQSEYPIVLDQVTDNANKLADKLREARDNGFAPEYVFVDRPPQGAAQGIVGRAVRQREEGKTARTVNIAHGLKANIDARRVALEVLRNHPDVPAHVIDNRGEHGGARYDRQLISDRGQAIAYLERRLAEDEAEIAGGLQAKITEHLRARHAAGEIDDDLMAGFLGRGWDAPVTPAAGAPSVSTLPALPHARCASRAAPARFPPRPGSGTYPPRGLR